MLNDTQICVIYVITQSLSCINSSFMCVGENNTCGGEDTRLLALFFCLEAVLVALTASVPELSTSVGLFVVVPANDVVSTGALTQTE